MRKFSIVLLSVLLLIVFVGCDLSVETMGKMGNNLAGTDKNYVASIIKQTEPEAAVIKTVGDTKTIAGSNFSISTSEGKGSIKIAGEPVDVPEALQDAINTVLTDSDFKSIILPTDISDIVQGLKSGNNSADIKEELKNKAEGASLEAAQGTVALVEKMLDVVKDAVDDNDSKGKINEIIGSLPDKDSITNGDVVVLTALSNIVFNEIVLSNVESIMEKPESPSEEDTEEEASIKIAAQKKYDSAMTEVTGELMNQVSSLLDVVTNVPSGMSNKINDFINNFMDNSDNKEEAK